MTLVGDRVWHLVIDQLGRPPTTNRAHSQHHQRAGVERRRWRDTVCWAVRAQRIPALSRIVLTTQGRYPSGRSLPDTDGLAPAVKGVLDGLVLAGVIEDDRPAWVAQVTALAPVVAPGLPPALLVTVREVPT